MRLPQIRPLHSLLALTPAIGAPYLVYWWNVEMGPDGRAREVNMQNTVVRR